MFHIISVHKKKILCIAIPIVKITSAIRGQWVEVRRYKTISTIIINDFFKREGIPIQRNDFGNFILIIVDTEYTKAYFIPIIMNIVIS